MREIEVYNIKDDSGIDIGKTNAELILPFLMAPEGKGADYAEMVKMMPIIEKFTSASIDRNILLEESEYIEVEKRVKKGPYSFTSKQILEMITKVITAPKVNIKVVD